MMSDFKRYVSTVEVDARKLEEDETVVTSNGPVEAVKGQYAVKDQAGTVTVADVEEFERTHRPATSSTVKGSKS